MEGKKTRTLENHKGAAPKVKSVQKRGRPRDPIRAWLPPNCPPFFRGALRKSLLYSLWVWVPRRTPGSGVCGVENFSTFHKMMNAFIRRIIGLLAIACV